MIFSKSHQPYLIWLISNMLLWYAQILDPKKVLTILRLWFTLQINKRWRLNLRNAAVVLLSCGAVNRCVQCRRQNRSKCRNTSAPAAAEDAEWWTTSWPQLMAVTDLASFLDLTILLGILDLFLTTATWQLFWESNLTQSQILKFICLACEIINT